MTGTSLALGICVFLGGILFLTAIITAIFNLINADKKKVLPNVYLGKLSNTDASISDAMKYLELTNGIAQQINGEKK